ncbi:uncharacterized protein SPSK_08154 [Sporothrix schenckii 1099-18]|uniref:Uncharacterized protein n=1 Tax=Sporothrix schenckii 1099-18 TaxID=1397361 RepID=A0A0F2MFN2_SPOSC|nr:uncharacterized protein SPSK_08154 [Sporothrix schenckii 1099-18]KJR87660.1 hypothetical protein SPSK_08154 [Sporothrix schenckii 1099-18]
MNEQNQSENDSERSGQENCYLDALSGLTYGYAFSVFSTSIGQSVFYAYFDLSTSGPRAGYTNSVLGAINALFSVGAASGALLPIAWLPN